jgi:ribose-phosphate pyrophosphokinase
MAKQLNAELAIIDKRRPRANEAKVMHIIGEIEGRACVLMDDMVDTANTLCEAASALKRAGASQVKACCTHPVLSGQSIKRINESELDEIVVTNSIPLSETAESCRKIRQISISNLLAESIRRIASGDSVSSLFID